MNMTHTLKADEDGMVDFGEVARGILGRQCQYISRYVSGVADTPILADGLRVSGDKYDYHSLRIHRDDVDTFVSRVHAHWNRYEIEG
jgi:hypothetical protein